MENPDDLIQQVSDALDPISDEIEMRDDMALFSIFARFIPNEDESEDTIRTYVNCTGPYDVIHMAFYAKLLDDVRDGDMDLFLTIRSAIRQIEEEVGIDPEDDIDPEDEELVLH